MDFLVDTGSERFALLPTHQKSLAASSSILSNLVRGDRASTLVQKGGLGAFYNVAHRPHLLMQPFPEGLVVLGVVIHGVGEFMTPPPPHLFQCSWQTSPPLTPLPGLVGGWGWVDHGDGTNTGGMGQATLHIGTPKCTSFLCLVTRGEVSSQGSWRSMFLQMASRSGKGSPPPPSASTGRSSTISGSGSTGSVGPGALASC